MKIWASRCISFKWRRYYVKTNCRGVSPYSSFLGLGMSTPPEPASCTILGSATGQILEGSALRINPSMVVSMLTMHMLVGNLFLTGLAHADDFDLKAQRLAC